MNQNAIVLALLSAGLFGASTPAAKVLLGTIDPAILAGLLYCGAGVGVAVVRRAGQLAGARAGPSEAPLNRGDVPILQAPSWRVVLPGRSCSWPDCSTPMHRPRLSSADPRSRGNGADCLVHIP